MATTRLERWNLQDLIVLMSLLPESGLLGDGAKGVEGKLAWIVEFCLD
jgi:hypothetical protein